MDDRRDRGQWLSDKREANTGVAVVRKRNTKEGMISELREINGYLEGTDDIPLNKTEHERLRRRKAIILRRLSGADPRWSVMRGRPGPPRENEVVPFAIKKASMDIIGILNKNRR